MLIVGIGLLLLLDICSVFYALIVKPFEEKLILFFWGTSFSYVGYIIYGIIQHKLGLHIPDPVDQIVSHYMVINVPFYILVACCSFAGYALFSYLLEHYDLSLISPLSKINMLFIMSVYLLLGEPFKLASFIGVLIVFCGAILSALPDKKAASTSSKNQLSLMLWGLIIISALLKTVTKASLFLLTQKTPVTAEVQRFIDHIFHHLHPLYLTFVNPFEYNIGVSFFMILIFLLYLVFKEKKGIKVFTILKDHYPSILTLSALKLLNIILYFSAFSLIDNKLIISPFLQLYLPMILIASYWFLKEQVTRQKVIGYTIITIGAIISVF